MVLRLWVPLSHWLWARNWNRAASGASLTASRTANSVAVSTPLRTDSLMVVISFSFWFWCASCGGEEVLVLGGQGWPGRQLGRFGVEGSGELLLQDDEVGHGRVAGQGDGQVEDLPQGAVTPALVSGQHGVRRAGAPPAPARFDAGMR